MGKYVGFWYIMAALFLTLLWMAVSELVALPIIPSPFKVVDNLADIFMKYIKNCFFAIIFCHNSAFRVFGD